MSRANRLAYPTDGGNNHRDSIELHLHRTHWSMDLAICFLFFLTALSYLAALARFCLFLWARVSLPDAGVGFPSDRPASPSSSSSEDDSS